MFRKWQMCYTNVWTKGHIEPKARRAVDSSKKRTKEFVLFAVKSKKGNKTNLFLRFLGEPTVRQSAYRFNWPLEKISLFFLGGRFEDIIRTFKN